MTRYHALAHFVAIRCLASAFAFPYHHLSRLPNHHSFVPSSQTAPSSFRRQTRKVATAALRMGLLDNLGSFLGQRDGDFIRLEDSADCFGPGPAILLFGCPEGISDEELSDMIEDGAPNAGNVLMQRIDAASPLFDLTVSEALEKVVREGTCSSGVGADGAVKHSFPVPVLYFSGFPGKEMMATYRIIASEIYAETGGTANAACAKAVPPAMKKPLRQVIEEITGDHEDAIGMSNEQ